MCVSCSLLTLCCPPLNPSLAAYGMKDVEAFHDAQAKPRGPDSRQGIYQQLWHGSGSAPIVQAQGRPLLWA